MSHRLRVSLLVLSLGILPSTLPDSPGALLQPGMQLVYSSNGQDQPPWHIDSVRADNALRPGSACVVLHQRRQAGQTQPDESRLCLANDTLFGWNAERSEWRAQRPVRPGMTMEFIRANGDKVRFETGEPAEEKISGLTIPVIPTIVTTSDSLARPKRRLRERFSIGLVTATGGVFEVPDSTTAGAWRTQQAFELREIRTP
jgi:hypothetical protein